jgi:hypothetical protein
VATFVILSASRLTHQVTNIAFFGPRIYERRKEKIDQVYSALQKEIQTRANELLEKVPALSLKEDKEKIQ